MQKTASPEVYELFRSTAREFVLKEVMPLASRIDKEDEFPVDIFKKMGKLGFLGVTIPEEYGGSGMDYKAQAIIEEELGYASASLALSYGAHSNLCLDNLYRNGSLLSARMEIYPTNLYVGISDHRSSPPKPPYIKNQLF